MDNHTGMTDSLKKGHLTFDSTNKYVRALFFDETTIVRLQITYNGKTIIHNMISKKIQKEIIKIGGDIKDVETAGKRRKTFFINIPIKVLTKKNSSTITVEVTGFNDYEVTGKLTKIKDELEKHGARITECTHSGEVDFLGVNNKDS